MSEENQVQEDAVEQDTIVEDVLEKESSVEDQAKAQGWLPPDQAVEKGLDPKDAVDAQSFLDRGPLMKQIKMLNQRNRTMAQQFDALMSEVREAKVQGYEQAVAELQSQRDQAFDDLDNQRVRELDNQIEEHKKAKDDYVQKQTQQQFDPETVEFVNRNNDWWGKEPDTMQYAVTVEKQIKMLNSDLDLDEVYDKVQEQVDSFRNAKGRSATKAETKQTPRKDKVSYVAPPQRASGNSGEPGSYSFHDLTSGAKDTYMTMKNYYKDEFQKEYTVDDFVKNQKSAGYTKLTDIVKR